MPNEPLITPVVAAFRRQELASVKQIISHTAHHEENAFGSRKTCVRRSIAPFNTVTDEHLLFRRLSQQVVNCMLQIIGLETVETRVNREIEVVPPRFHISGIPLGEAARLERVFKARENCKKFACKLRIKIQPVKGRVHYRFRPARPLICCDSARRMSALLTGLCLSARTTTRSSSQRAGVLEGGNRSTNQAR